MEEIQENEHQEFLRKKGRGRVEAERKRKKKRERREGEERGRARRVKGKKIYLERGMKR